MSHLLESYSLQTGAKISKPFIIKNFYPTPEKYITIHNSSGMGSKNYDYFQDVVDEIAQELNENGIQIVQIGGAEDNALEKCVNLQGKTSYYQTAFIIENSLLHIGNDSFPVHLASASNIPIIALYSVTIPEIAGPFFNSEKSVCLVPDYKGDKPSFNPNESPKTVNTINIEKIIDNVYKILKLESKQKIKSIYIGEKYIDKVIEFVPDTIINPAYLSNVSANMRLDLLKTDIDENIIFANLQNKKFKIYMSDRKKISNIQIFKILKDNIEDIFFDISNEPEDISYIKNLVQNGIKPKIIYKNDNKKYFNNIKIELIDLNLKFIQINTNKNNNINLELDEDTHVKTNRLILCNKKVFLSEAHLKEGKDTNSKEGKLNNIKNLQELQKELDYFLIYKKIKNNV